MKKNIYSLLVLLLISLFTANTHAQLESNSINWNLEEQYYEENIKTEILCEALNNKAELSKKDVVHEKISNYAKKYEHNNAKKYHNKWNYYNHQWYHWDKYSDISYKKRWKFWHWAASIIWFVIFKIFLWILFLSISTIIIRRAWEYAWKSDFLRFK